MIENDEAAFKEAVHTDTCRLRELTALAQDGTVPLSEREWASREREELLTKMARRLLTKAGLRKDEPSE
jgi:hypothetical protein